MIGKGPWVTGFLTNLLITYLENHFPGDEAEIDYRKLLAVYDGLENVKVPKEVLKNVNNWVPHEILQDTIKICEEISGDKKVTYNAAVEYFDRSKKMLPSIIEIIALTMPDIRKAIICSDLWASAYTNYLMLQSFQRDESEKEVCLISKFGSEVRPRIGDSLLIKGNYEGFSRLYDFVYDSSLDEEISELRIEEIVGEFMNYKVQEEGNGLLISDSKGRIYVRAVGVLLTTEKYPSPWEYRFRSKDSFIARPSDGSISVLTRRPASGEVVRNGCYMIKEGGTIGNGSLSYTFREGEIYNAPYSRYRFRWREREMPDNHINRMANVPFLLFGHLNELKEAQSMTLSCIRENIDLNQENYYLKTVARKEHAFGGIIGESDKMQDLFKMVKVVSKTDSTLLITGETGTGKELVAKAIHHNSPRREKKFVDINCGALSEGILESELFGHEKGAFTGAISQKKGKFEAADGGTLFLDEIGDISQGMQVKLLRVLQEREFHRVGGNDRIRVDVRIIAATNQEILRLIDEGRFRRDLYYRLNVIQIHTPPLRERLSDIPYLCSHFITGFNKKSHKKINGLSEEAMQILLRYSWPGNVRELEGIIERGSILSGSDLISAADLPENIRDGERGETRGLGLESAIAGVDWANIAETIEREGTIDSILERVEWGLVKKSISAHGGNKSRAAKALNRSYRWIRKIEKKMEEREKS
ncbi:MAG TPA: sigma-54 dependent transcriptional regulator [Nitrospiria bacterium]|nr:sigma-54 dependent transcriptional regulator [Nitrospiria bacterium]